MVDNTDDNYKSFKGADGLSEDFLPLLTWLLKSTGIAAVETISYPVVALNKPVASLNEHSGVLTVKT